MGEEQSGGRAVRSRRVLRALAITVVALPVVASGSLSRDARSADAVRRGSGSASLPWATVRLEAQDGVRSVIRYGGYLSGPHADVREYLRAHAGLLGLDAPHLDNLVPVQDYTTRHNGSRQVFLRQLDRGRTVYGSLLKVTLDRDGRVVTVGGAYFPEAFAAGNPAVSADQAVLAAARSIGARPARALHAISKRSGPSRLTTFRNTIATLLRSPGPLTAELVTYATAPARAARLAWKTLVESDRGWFEVVVDARSGKVLSRSSYAAYAPEGNVYTVAHPDLGSQHIVSFAGAAFDNAGWVSGTTTAGNNANVYEDLNNDDVAEYQPQTPPLGDPAYQHFDYTFTNAIATSGGTDATTDRDAALTQAFYWINFLHDYYYGLGFDEPAGNFQDDNFGRGGIAGDGMLVEVHNGFTANPETSNTQTPPLQHPRMELEINGTADGAMDEDLISHEYTHGVSNRLLNGEATGGGLPFGPQTWALGEGWSDFMSTSITEDPIAGEYICLNPNGCPLYPYDASPLVYSDLCQVTNGCEPHRDGEIWTAALWDIRKALGRNQTEQLVIDGMKNTTPARASFLDARDGILAADMIDSGGANQCLLWHAFAAREMGLGSSTPDDQLTVTPATDVPAGCVPTAEAGGPYTTTEGTEVILSAADSSAGSDPSGGAIVSYEWDLDNDGHYDATGSSATFDAVGQDGVFTVGLRVTNAAGVSDTDTTTVTVLNVAPTVVWMSTTPVGENSPVTVSGKESDPGWLDVLSGTIDWGDGTVQPLGGVLENDPPNATLTFSISHTYGDDGTFGFGAKICVADDDTAPCVPLSLQIDNVAPTAVIDLAGATIINGIPTILGQAGQPVDFTGRSQDPGSDDLTLTWDFGDGTPNVVVVSLVNPPFIDPDPSPTIQPRNLTNDQTHTFADACIYTIEFTSADDDSGAASAAANVLIQGTAGGVRNAAYWKRQYGGQGKVDFDQATLNCYLAIATYVSAVFNEKRDASTIAAASDVLTVNNGSPQLKQLDQQLLAALLNFANGGLSIADLTAIAAAEAVRLNPASTVAQIHDARLALQKLNGA